MHVSEKNPTGVADVRGLPSSGQSPHNHPRVKPLPQWGASCQLCSPLLLNVNRQRSRKKLGGGLRRWLSGKEPVCQCRRHKRCGFDPWIKKITWRKQWQPTAVFLPGESPWTEEPGKLHCLGVQRVGHDWSNWASVSTQLGGKNKNKRKQF